MPTPHVLVMPLMVPPPFNSQAYPPVGGLPVQPYALAPPQHPFTGYPPPQWPQYPPYYLASQGLYEGIRKLPNLRSLRVVSHRSYTPLLPVVSWPLTAALASL